MNDWFSLCECFNMNNKQKVETKFYIKFSFWAFCPWLPLTHSSQYMPSTLNAKLFPPELVNPTTGWSLLFTDCPDSLLASSLLSGIKALSSMTSSASHAGSLCQCRVRTATSHPATKSKPQRERANVQGVITQPPTLRSLVPLLPFLARSH